MEEIKNESESSVGVIAATVVAAALVVILVVAVVVVILFRKLRVMDIYKKRVVRQGISKSILYYTQINVYSLSLTGNAVYSNTETDAIRLGAINADIYDYPTLSSIDIKPPV